MIIRSLLRARPNLSRVLNRHLRTSPWLNLTVTRMKMSTSSPPSLTNVAINTEHGIAVVKYNRPKSGNALNTPTLKDILAALRWADSNLDTRVIILTGEGKLYTAGLDLLDPINQGPDSTISDAFTDTLSDVHKNLIMSNKVLISAVNGPAPGWGTSSLALTDLVYSTPDAFFFTPFVQWGLCAEACSSHTFKTIMGRQKASALILAGQRMTAQELESAGLITKILPKESFLEDVLKVARDMIKLPAETLKVNKELMMRGTREQLLVVNDMELETLRKQARGEESRTAIATFAEAQARKKRERSKL